jgi:enoyl-CoA hydratase
VERQELETVIYEKEGPVARIILNRPEKANAQNSAMVWDVENSLIDAERDYDIKVVIMKANGRGFSAGHDVGGGPMGMPEFVKASEAGHPWQGQAELFLWPVLHLWEFPKPTIAAVQGYALGAGATSPSCTTSWSPRTTPTSRCRCRRASASPAARR